MDVTKFNQEQISSFASAIRDNGDIILSLVQNNEDNKIDFFKSGNKIKIKKQNRGKFTDYCGGNVTEACIRKGKNSPDPKIRKRATFAANARKWNK